MKEERTENKDKKILTLDFAPVIMEVTMKGVVDGNFLLLNPDSAWYNHG